MENETYITIGSCISMCSLEESLQNKVNVKVGDKHVTIKNMRSGLFYSFSYESGNRCLILKKWWHYYPAIIVESARRLLPEKLQKFLKLIK